MSFCENCFLRALRRVHKNAWTFLSKDYTYTCVPKGIPDIPIIRGWFETGRKEREDREKKKTHLIDFARRVGKLPMCIIVHFTSGPRHRWHTRNSQKVWVLRCISIRLTWYSPMFTINVFIYFLNIFYRRKTGILWERNTLVRRTS